MALDQSRLEELLGRFVQDFGATGFAATVVIGDKLGLYQALAAGPATSAELAHRTSTHPRLVTEWLAAQAASGYVSYDPDGERFWLSEEQAFALAHEDGPMYLPGAFQVMVAAVKDEPKVTEAFRSGAGVGWHEHDPDLFTGTERFFRPGYAANLVASWIPALDGVQGKLEAGAKVADIGCGHGASTLIMAHAYPNSTFVGFDYHQPSIERAREAAAKAGVADRCRFQVAAASDYSGAGYDLVTIFDALHDMGDPVGAAAHVHQTLAPEGTFLLVEPYAADRLEDNLTPVGRAFYAASTLLCVPHSLSEPVGLALGAQAGEQRLREVATAAGFGRFRRVAETPFNLVYEARP
jgi:2-polyprenyl-3-methyl-5-hydroxy-6-metoxy-1,4-benzoquinol methylase